MNQLLSKKIKRWWAAMLLTIIALVCPLSVMADRYEQQSTNYQIYLSGTDVLTIIVPVFDKDGADSWVRNGRLFYSVKGESKETLVLFWGVNDAEDEKDIDPEEYKNNRNDWENYGDNYIYAHLKTEAFGTVYCQIESDKREEALEKDKVQRNKIYTHSGDKYNIRARWVVPDDLRGKEINFKWKVRRSGHLRYREDVKGLEESSITIPDAPPAMEISVSRPFLLPDNVGKLMVPWIIGSDKVKQVQIVYNDANNREKVETLPDTTKVGVLPVEATVPHRSFYLKVDYYNSEGKLVQGQVSEPQSLPMIHAPKNFKATPLDDGMGSVLLTWENDCLNDEDLIEGDFFEIERSITGNEEDFTNLGMEAFDINQSEFSFKDSTLLESLSNASLDRYGSLPKVIYRIRRGATSFWGWKGNPTYTLSQTILGNMNLLQPINAKSELVDETQHTVKVTWDYRPSDDFCWYVWDKRAKMLLTVYMRNRDNQIVDSVVYTLTQKEINEKTKTLTLSRPCINYEAKITITQDDVPIGKSRITLIQTLSDWADLCRYVQKGGETDDLVVSFECDIYQNGTTKDYLLGTATNPFQGILEGNGHFINPANTPKGYYYFIENAKGAIIRNLNVNAFFSNGSSITGLINEATNTVIDKCVFRINCDRFDSMAGVAITASNVTVQNSAVIVDGLPSNSQFSFGGYFLTSDNCKFINSLVAVANSVISTSNVDYIYPYYANGNATLENCYFNSDKRPADSQGSTVIRGSSISPSSLGDKWTSTNTFPYVTPIMSEVIEFVPYSFEYLEVEGPSYYYDISGKVEKGLQTRTLQSSVVLNWEMSEGEVDYCEVLRREVGYNRFDTIATNIVGTVYEDKKVSPLKKYEYTVRSAVNCEGTKYEYTDTVVGMCKDTGMLEGNVRFLDGTGIPGLTINVIDPNGKLAATVKTDDSGYYKVENLSYQNKTNITYMVEAVATTSMKFEKDKSQFYITFDDEINYGEVSDFVVVSGYRFSGYVMYEGTSIPVPGVNFSVDGHDVHTASGKLLETDNDGKYSFYVLGENVTTIIAKKEGHNFINGGKFEYAFVDKLSDIYFYDATTVKLIGRVVGGNAQGDLPLGNSLSHNNLGSDLTMVLTLEGDNTSSLVYDNLHPLITERDTLFTNKHRSSKNVHETAVHFYRKRMVVRPDQTTGEFTLMLPPVKWKVQQIYCNGYGTLFQEGKASDVVDLTDSLTLHKDTYTGSWLDIDGITAMNPTVEYNGIYNCIYHAPIELRYTQINYDTFDYLGDKSYTAYNQGGNKEIVPLAYPDTTNIVTGKNSKILKAKYTFGHPVFNINRPYTFELSAQERYYWNNDQRTDTIDIVQLSGGTVYVHNGLESSTSRKKVDLNENGIGYVELMAAQIVNNLTQEDALRTVTMTLEIDGTTCEAEPFDAYILNLYSIPGASDILNSQKPVLVDILRDPPGSSSTATLSKGSSLKYSYTMDMKWSAGISMELSSGTGMTNYYGATTTAPVGVTGPSFGVIQDAKTSWEYNNDFTFSGSGSRAFNYTMTATEDIKTSGSVGMVGANADLYIGVVQNNIVKPAVAIRAVSDSVFHQMVGQLAGGILPTGNKAKTGSMAEIAEGKDANGNVFHLVRNETMSFGAEITSSFIHPQKYITDQIIPELFQQCRSLMFIGTPEEAQQLANSTKKNVYLSLREPSDSSFAVMNIVKGEPVIYTLKDHNNPKTRREDMNYVIVKPENYSEKYLNVDEVQKYCGIMLEWIKMIKRNEEEKLAANDLVRNFDVDGGGSLTYGENFESQYANSSTVLAPFGINLDSYFTENITSGEALLDAANVFGKTFGAFCIKMLSKVMKSDNVKVEGTKDDPDKYFLMATEVNFTGSRIKFLIYPTLSYTVTPKNTKTQTYNRKESFSIGMTNGSHLNFDVYRVNCVKNDSIKSSDMLDVFTSQNFDNMEEFEEPFLNRHFDIEEFGDDFYRTPRGFVYRTRGGATAQPWENQRTTIFHNPGTELDARTLKIENPKIKLDKQSVSGVPYGEPAVFKVYLTNESEAPNAISTSLSYYKIFQEDKSNPNGAKMFIDGTALTGDGREIYVVPGSITEKTLEVYAGSDFDYSGLQIGIVSKGDLGIKDLVSFDVHYLHTAGPVNISTPGDKWVMNTDAPYNAKGYYLPVKIDGFDRKQKNFDHIEFQYKETARGDDHWVNLCSFYADDSLMSKASGTKRLMPENGYIDTEFYGDQIIMEKAYDLRAVLFVRNGSSFLTSSSKVLSGIKDTRRPQLFGLPSPSDGILDIGENVIFNFSEAIEHNYIDHKTDFEVKGEVNNSNISETVALQFPGPNEKGGGGSVETEAERNFNGKDLTISMIVYPETTGEEMPLFSHGKDNKRLQLWLTKEMKLKAVVNNVDDKYISDSTISTGSFQQVAMVIQKPAAKQKRWTLTLLNGGKVIGSFDMDEPYTGTSKLIFGRTNHENRNDPNCKYYTGRMMEARVWYRALTPGLIGNTYGNKRLTGYEKGLVAYYPMDEGNGYYVIDKAQGAHAQIIDAAWALPRNMSLKLDWEDRGMALSKNALSRTTEDDYTLMFWFKTNVEGRGALIGNGSGHADDEGAENQFFIGFEGEQLLYRSNGMQIDIPGDYSDNTWHHYAMTINRARNVGNIYLDCTLSASFPVDALGGISGGYPMLGATLHKSKKDSLVSDTHNWLRGNLDEICLFGQALPLSLIKSFSTKSPSGEEAGLLAYLAFSRQERQSNNMIEAVPYAYSLVVYRDDNGNLRYEEDKITHKPTDIPMRDYLFNDSIPVSKVLDHIDKNQAAPVRPYEELKNINFSFVARDNQLLVSIDEPTEYINKRNIYVTVRNIADLNGNSMASPTTLSCFIDCNPLRWDEKTIKREMHYGVGDIFGVRIKNLSGMNHTYNVENCPKWLSVQEETNIIGPKEEKLLTFKVNENLNIGTFDEIIYLTDESGLSEPLMLDITVFSDAPYWFVNNDIREYSMNIVGRVVMGSYDNYEIISDTRDMVGVFDRDGNCHGMAHITYEEDKSSPYIYLTVYNNATSMDKFYFKLWHHATGQEMLLTNYDDITFVVSKLYGNKNEPCMFYADNQYIQTLQLEKGWNWVSFNVYNRKTFKDLDALLSGFQWQNGDIITDNTNGITLIYTNNHWCISGDIKDGILPIEPMNSYAVKVKESINVQLAGYILKSKDDRTIYIHNGWNSIGYTPMMTLPLETALADYYEFAKDGDIIKSHDEFAIFNADAYGGGRWEGNLNYMKPGEGYMLFHGDNTKVEFAYPFYEPGSIFIEEVFNAPTNRVTDKPSTMSLTAIVDGLALHSGDRLLTFADGELRGATTLSADSLFFMSIAGDHQEGLSFAIEREGDIIATTGEIMSFQSNAIMGKPQTPTRINFMPLNDKPQRGWYTLDGIRLQDRPTKKGVYIFNGKKRVIE